MAPGGAGLGRGTALPDPSARGGTHWARPLEAGPAGPVCFYTERDGRSLSEARPPVPVSLRSRVAVRRGDSAGPELPDSDSEKEPTIRRISEAWLASS